MQLYIQDSCGQMHPAPTVSPLSPLAVLPSACFPFPYPLPIHKKGAISPSGLALSPSSHVRKGGVPLQSPRSRVAQGHAVCPAAVHSHGGQRGLPSRTPIVRVLLLHVIRGGGREGGRALSCVAVLPLHMNRGPPGQKLLFSAARVCMPHLCTNSANEKGKGPCLSVD